MPKRRHSGEGFPYDATPDVHHFPGVPRSSFDVVNMYGTYNIQPTSDTENLFPLIEPSAAWCGAPCGCDCRKSLSLRASAYTGVAIRL